VGRRRGRPHDRGPPEAPRHGRGAWADRNPAADRRYKAARAAVVTRAEELDLPVENLLTPETLRVVSWEPPQPIATETVGAALASHDARPWQVEETASIIAHAFVAAAQAPAAESNTES
jgi:ribonuclease D